MVECIVKNDDRKKVKKIGQDWEISEEDDGEKKNKKDPSTSEKTWIAADYFNIGWYLVSPILLGVLIGIYLDKVFHTKPLFILGFIFFGFVASIYNLWKLTKSK